MIPLQHPVLVQPVSPLLRLCSELPVSHLLELCPLLSVILSSASSGSNFPINRLICAFMGQVDQAVPLFPDNESLRTHLSTLQAPLVASKD